MLACAVFASGASALATWSVVAIDTATGEVCIASATCLQDFNLRRGLAVVVVGKGAGAAQSFLDSSSANRQRMRNGILAGLTPAEILIDLDANDSGHQTRQYGIVSADGFPVTFSGSGAGNAKHEVAGRTGTISYAIQGNVLTADIVITAAEDAFLSSTGDLGQRVMEAMEAARSFGGDGRCSCTTGGPQSCGAPPPNMTKSAHTAFVVLARMGDTDGTCGAADGCANGDYYLYRKSIGNWSDPDPVLQLNRRYLQWRRNKEGKPDHILSTVDSSVPRLVADGLASTTVTLRLIDLEGNAIAHGGQTLTISDVTAGGVTAAVAGLVTDHGDGSHSFELTSTMQAAEARFQILVRQGTLDVQLHPELVVPVDPARELHIGLTEVSASAVRMIPFTVDRPADAGVFCRILASASGIFPGTPFGGTVLPLNHDRVLDWTLSNPVSMFPGSHAALDAGGRLTADLMTNQQLLGPFIGGRLDFCAAIGSTAPVSFTNVAGFDILP